MKWATKDKIFDNPLHPYTKSLLASIPQPDPYYEVNVETPKYDPIAEHDYSRLPTLREVEEVTLCCATPKSLIDIRLV